MKTKQGIQSPRIGRITSWEEDLFRRRQENRTEPRVRLICSCRNGDLYFEEPNIYQYRNRCSYNRACAVIRRDIRKYGSS